MMVSRKYIIVPVVAAAVTGCGFLKKAAKSAEDALNSEPDYPGVPGETAINVLAKASYAASTDVNAIKEALSLAEGDAAKEGAKLYGLVDEEEGDVGQVSTATIDYLLAGQAAKESISTSAYAQPSNLVPTYGEKNDLGLMADAAMKPIADPEKYKFADDSVPQNHPSWKGRTEFLVSNVNFVPVRNQAERGTCAAFTGIGALEHQILKKYPALKGVDLSEQRFYYMSRPDLWAKNGGVAGKDMGSYWNTGFGVSSGSYESEFGGQTYNIPLEADCPYVSKNINNELQMPLQSSCNTGALKVKKESETYWMSSGGGPKQWSSSGLLTADQILRYLDEKDLPVPVATALDDAWMDNDGMITIARSKQLGTVKDSIHAAGHAYLIVGARRLDPNKFPGEGNMCFIIKNSWGLGWGANGFSCMTLAWFNHFRYKMAFDLALDIDVNSSYIASKLGTGPVDEPVDGEGEDDSSDSAGGDEGGEGDEGSSDGSQPDQGNVYKDMLLLSGSGEGLKALVSRSGSQITIRGIRADGNHTDDLVMQLDGDKIMHTQEKNLMDVVKQVGYVASDRVVLCGEKFVNVCHLNYVPDSNALVVGLTEAEFRNDDADPNGYFEDLINFAGYGIQAAMPGLTRIDIRLVLGGVQTNPLRFKISYTEGHIWFKDKIIGNFHNRTFCSGEYASVCRVVVGLEDHKLNVLFKAAKK